MNDSPFDPAKLRSLLIETRCEFLRLWRAPAFVIPTLSFPLLFYVLFGILLGRSGKGGYDASLYMLASYYVFGVMSPGLYGFGVSVALERERGLLRLKRALPMPAANYLLAKLFMAMLFAALIFVALATLAATAGGVHLGVVQWLGLGLVCVLGVVPFCALGLFIGTRVGAAAAPGVVNLIHLPMAFLSGLAIPLFLLPAPLQAIANLWPAYHLGQLAQLVVGQPARGDAGLHLAVLGGYSLLFFLAAQRRLARGDMLTA